MPLSHGYGVAIGTFASFARENPTDYGTWYHGKLRIDTPAGQYEAALDVDTPSGVGVSYRVVADLTTHDIPLLAALPDGYSPLVRTSTSGALDYVRSPVLQDGWVVRRLRWWIGAISARRRAEPWGPTLLDRTIGWMRWLWQWRWRSFPWVSSNGDNALDVLEALFPTATRIYVLGEPYTSGLGVHNVHMNQGDPPGSHQDDDGTWQDGAVLVQRSDGSVTAWQVKFNTQSLHTDDDGLPA
ncbi:DUF2278 family protein [Nocardioides sp. MH1]|uniref:DUF2278 family protein n=1 Tax=Nocardioides sp. MH1 TaxID=3242490 RepID=UPI00352232D8